MWRQSSQASDYPNQPSQKTAGKLNHLIHPPTRPANKNGFGPGNRKYLGCKKRLLQFLDDAITASAGEIGSFLDAFAGTGVVADHFADLAAHTIANDILLSNYIGLHTFLASRSELVHLDRIAAYLDLLNTLPGCDGYITHQFGSRYFTIENARQIDAIRDHLAGPARAELTKAEQYILLTSLLYAADKVANTVGQYDAFLKHLGKPTYTDGIHHVDVNAYHPLHLEMPAVTLNRRAEARCQDANQLVNESECHVLYLDPPYNCRDYIDCYHVLENLVRWERPLTSGKTRKFPRHALRSAYSQRRKAGDALAELIAHARCEHIFVSYNSEGILSTEDIFMILSSRGPMELLSTNYPVFGRGAGRARKRNVKELLFWCRVIKPAKSG